MEYDLKIMNGKVFASGMLMDLDIIVSGEKIAFLAEHGNTFSAKREIDVSGKIVLPGVVDLHVHVREPGFAHKEDWTSASKAAAVGGVTTIIDMPNVEPPTTTVDLFRQKKEIAQGQSIVDFGHFVSGIDVEEVPRLAEAGVTGFKIFQVSGAYPHDPRLAENDDGKLLRIFEAIARTGLICVVHPFNQSLFEYFSEQAFAQGKPRDIVTFAEIYTREVIWSTAVHTLIALQGCSGVRLHVCHTHSADSLTLLKKAKAAQEGWRVTVEIDPKYFLMTHRDLMEKGPLAIWGGFVSENAQRMKVIYDSLNDGTIDNISSEHAPHLLKEVDIARTDAWSAPLGNPNIEHFFPVLATECHRGKYPLKRLVNLLSERPAQILGLYPQKGALLPGSDADIIVVDWENEAILSDKGLYTKVGVSPWSGRKVTGLPVMTISRGEIVAENGLAVGRPGRGRYLQAQPFFRG